SGDPDPTDQLSPVRAADPWFSSSGWAELLDTVPERSECCGWRSSRLSSIELDRCRAPDRWRSTEIVTAGQRQRVRPKVSNSASDWTSPAGEVVTTRMRVRGVEYASKVGRRVVCGVLATKVRLARWVSP